MNIRHILLTQKKDVLHAWIVSGAIHLMVIAVVVVIAALQIRDSDKIQIVSLVSEGEGRPSVRQQAKPQEIINERQSPQETPAIQPAIKLSQPVAVPPQVQASSMPISGPLKKEMTAANSSGAGSHKGPVDAKFGDAAGPGFLHQVQPVYPNAARSMNREGRVLLRLTIDEVGKLINLEVIEAASYGFTEAAVYAIRKSTFIPAKRAGIAVASRAILPVRFELLR
jgi:periplasmic protein TonB